MQSCDLNDVMRAIGTLEGSVREGFEGIHRRQDITNGRIDKQDNRISILESTSAKETGRRSAYNWVGGLVYSGLALGAGILGSFIQAGKL